MKWAGTVVIAALALSLGACGSNGSGVSQAARNDLNPLVVQARERAAAHDVPGAERALATLRQEMKRLQRSDDVSPANAAAITHAVSEVQRALTLVTTTTVTTVAPAPPAPPPGKDHGPGHDHGGKHGHDKGNEHNGD